MQLWQSSYLNFLGFLGPLKNEEGVSPTTTLDLRRHNTAESFGTRVQTM
jgi:hypothetical protein